MPFGSKRPHGVDSAKLRIRDFSRLVVHSREPFAPQQLDIPRRVGLAGQVLSKQDSLHAPWLRALLQLLRNFHFLQPVKGSGLDGNRYVLANYSPAMRPRQPPPHFLSPSGNFRESDSCVGIAVVRVVVQKPLAVALEAILGKYILSTQAGEPRSRPEFPHLPQQFLPGNSGAPFKPNAADRDLWAVVNQVAHV